MEGETEREMMMYWFQLISAAMPGRALRAVHSCVQRKPLRILYNLRETLYVRLFLLCLEMEVSFRDFIHAIKRGLLKLKYNLLVC
jgi:hypothetical protein